MIINTKNFKIIFGKAVGHFIEDLIVSAKQRVWIISPWISEKYADLLLKLKEKNIDVKLVTSNDKLNEKSIKKLIEEVIQFKVKGLKRMIYISICISLIFINIFYFNLLTFIFSSLLFSLFAYELIKKEKLIHKKIDVEIVDRVENFMHSKIYLIDEYAIITSANFTESGFWRNYEFAIIIKNPEISKKVSKYFEYLKSNILIKKL